MGIDAIPLWAFFIGTTALILLSVEAGFWIGKKIVQRSPDEKESAAAAVGGAVLGLVAFMLAFTFGIAAARYDARKELVRDDADAIRTAWLRSGFVPDPDRSAMRALLREYVDLRISTAESGSLLKIPQAAAKSVEIQRQLWAYVHAHGLTDLNTDIGSSLVESINDLINVHAVRLAVAVDARIAPGIWLTLFAISVFGMVAMGYQMGIAGSMRSRTNSILAISFALVITLIAGLDRPQIALVSVSQKPLEDLRIFMQQPPERPATQQQ